MSRRWRVIRWRRGWFPERGRSEVGEPAVAVDVTPLAGARTGIAHFVRELLAALAALPQPPAVVPYVLSHTAPLPPGTRRLWLPAGLALRLWGRLGGPALDRSLAPAAVVHGTNFVVPPSRRRGLVVTVHDCAFARFPDLCSSAVRRFEPVVRRAIARGAWVHTPSEFVAREVRDLFGTERVRPIAYGVPHLPPASEAPEAVREVIAGGPYVLALGALEPRKRPAELVAAFGLVAAERTELRLVLAGPDGPARPAVDAALAALGTGVRDRVVLLGAVDDASRTALLEGAAVLAYPSLYEGFGFPVVEAMQAGTPVVATSTGALPEVAGDAALLVGLEVEELADGIRRVLADEGLRAVLVSRGRWRAKEFDWGRTAEGLLDLYREVAAR